MPLSVYDILALDIMRDVRLRCDTGLDREVRWVHLWPEVLPWPHGGELLLTTVYSWPPEPAEQRRIVRDLDRAGVAAILFRAGGPYFPEVPEAIPAEARSLGVPVLELATDVAFSDLVEIVNREIIRAQFETIERSDHIHRALTRVALEAQTVNEIAQRLEELTGRSVVILDAVLRPLSEPPRWWGAAAEPVRRALEPSSMSVRLPLGDRAEAAVFPVQTGQDRAGFVVIRAEDEKLTDLDMRAGDHAAVIVGLHLLRQQAVAEAETRVRNTFVEAVLQGKLLDDPALQERAQLLGFDPAGRYLVGVAALVDAQGAARARPLSSPEDFHRRRQLGQAWQQALDALAVPTFMAYSLNQVILLLPAEGDPGRVRRMVDDLYRQVVRADPTLRFALGVGRSTTGSGNIPASLEEAQAALEAGRGTGVRWYQDLVVLRVLHSTTDPHALQTLWEETLGALRAHGAGLYNTARALVHEGFRQRRTARVLGVHWNTLRYRITRMEQVLGASLDHPELRLKLHLALKAEEVLPHLSARPAPER